MHRYIYVYTNTHNTEIHILMYIYLGNIEADILESVYVCMYTYMSICYACM